MRFDLEEKFVHNYINKTKQERLFFELNSNKKRKDALWRFSHDTEVLLKNDKICLKLQNFDEAQLKHFLSEDEYYVISHKYLDGIMMSTKQVLEYLADEYTPVIVCGAKIALVKKEFESGNDNFFILK